MKRILVAIDGVSVTTNTIDFACYLGRLTKSHITGIVLENLPGERMTGITNGYDATYIEQKLDEGSPEHITKLKLIEQSIAFFKDACLRRDVSCTVHRDTEVPLKEMVAESRFADLMVIDAKTSFDEKYEGAPTSFAKGILESAECPVIVAPESFESIDEILFCYDQSASAMFSMKQ
ncbi:MAG: universal stress protein, partial [Sediminibacterium sp.]